MILSHLGQAPRIHSSAWVAPTATICGNVVIAANTCVAHGAKIIAEGAAIKIDRQSIVLENAVIRSAPTHPAKVGQFCLIGPNAHMVGCTLEDRVFVATGATVFHGAHLERESEVRVNATVHVRSRLRANESLPIGWIAVGDPARMFSPDQHDQIWGLQKPLNFPEAAYGLDRKAADMRSITKVMAARLSLHADDELVSENPQADSN